MNKITVTLPQKLSAELTRFAGRSAMDCDQLVRRALREYLDDMRDDAVRFKKAYRSRAAKTVSHEELKKSLGLA
jgi:metal-responsive CopG/Arc/MetJ family transcriptional regulator